MICGAKAGSRNIQSSAELDPAPVPRRKLMRENNSFTPNSKRKLDNVTHKYLKKWAGVPRCATNSIFHLQTALNIPSISQIYTESHVLTYVDAKMKASSNIGSETDRMCNSLEDYVRISLLYNMFGVMQVTSGMFVDSLAHIRHQRRQHHRTYIRNH